MQYIRGSHQLEGGSLDGKHIDPDSENVLPMLTFLILELDA